jgi:adenylate cyclase class 2
MTFEVELKARLRNPTEIEAKVAELGVFKGETFKEDVYFRRQGDTSLVPADRYRLRREGERSVVTFKQMVSAGGVEVNDETEFAVDNTHSFFQFADRFGFEPFVVKRKKSRVYQVGRAHVELNEVEHLGHFVEIEILCDQEDELIMVRTELARLTHKLGLDAGDLEPRPYILMIQETHPVAYKFINNPALLWPFEEILQTDIG